MLTISKAIAELNNLRNSDCTKWLYAFAMGSGCALELNDSISRGIRQREAYLLAFIREHKNDPALPQTIKSQWRCKCGTANFNLQCNNCRHHRFPIIYNATH